MRGGGEGWEQNFIDIRFFDSPFPEDNGGEYQWVAGLDEGLLHN